MIAGMSLNRRCFIAVSGCTVTMASSDSSSIVGAKMQQWPLHRTILFAKVSTNKILTKWNFRESSTKHSISRILYTIVDHGWKSTLWVRVRNNQNWKFRFVRSLSKTRLWANFVLLVLRLVFICKIVVSRNRFDDGSRTRKQRNLLAYLAYLAFCLQIGKWNYLHLSIELLERKTRCNSRQVSRAESIIGVAGHSA